MFICFVCLYAQFKPAKSAIYKKQRDYLVCKFQYRLSLCNNVYGCLPFNPWWTTIRKLCMKPENTADCYYLLLSR